jgi:hypothetical protein
MTSNRQLRYWYNKWNAKYFESSLPTDIHLLWEPVNGGIAEFDYTNKPWTIRLDPSMRFSKSMWSMALLHEMCHAKLAPNGKHGKKFQDEMLRLALAGAFKSLW